MIDAGIPVIDMDTLIAPLDQINVHSFLAPDNEFMGSSVTQALCSAIKGEGTIIMTQGALGHTGAQGRARIPVVVDRFQASRCWRQIRRIGTCEDGATLGDLSQHYPKIDAASSTTTTWRSPRPTS